MEPQDERAARAKGSAKPSETELRPGEEPDTRGTLFFMVVFLMLIYGFWIMMYNLLLHR